jgi:integrase
VVSIKGVDPQHINRQDALKALSIRKGEMAQGKFDIGDTKKPILFERFVARYLEEYSKPNKKSWTRDITSTNALLRFFSGKNLSQITSWLVEKYKAERQKEISRFGREISKSSINRELACLKTMFNKAIDWDLGSTNPVRKVRLFPEKPNKLRVVSDEEFQKVYNNASDFLKPILVTAMNTGMRRGEIFNLKWQDVNFKEGYILVRESKNNESRIIPINKVLMETLKSVKTNGSGEYIFSHNNRNDPVRTFKTAFNSTLRRSGVEKFRFHDLRHTFASRLVMAGVNIVTVQELMGHRNINMTKRYSHPTPEHKKQAVERLNSYAMDTYLDTDYTNKSVRGVVTI